MNQFLKTFRAAWYLPEASGDSKKSVAFTRAMLVILPVMTIVTTILAGIPFENFWISFGFSIIATVAFVVSIYFLFREYVPIVDQHLQLKKNFDVELGALVQEFFAYPDIIDLPIFETEAGDWVGYGHIPRKEFIDAVVKATEHLTGSKLIANGFRNCEDSIEYVYAQLINHPAIHGNLYFKYVSIDTPGAFPVTRLYI